MPREVSRKKIDKDAIKIFVKLRAEGLTLKVISQRTGFSTATIGKILKDIERGKRSFEH